jgi:hypothetical protein
MTATLTVPDGFSEHIASNLKAVREIHAETGKISEKHLDWLVENVKHLDILMHATADFSNIAAETVTELQGIVNTRDLKILDLETRNEGLEEQNDTLEGEIRRLYNDLYEAGALD